MLVVGACVIGLAPILVRLSGTGPAATGFWRNLFSLPLLFIPLVPRMSKPAAVPGRSSLGQLRPSRFAIVAGAAFALDLGFWHYGIVNTSVAKATVLANLTPIVVTAVAWLFFHERPAPLFLLAVALSVIGAAIMALAMGTGLSGPNPRLGDGLSMFTSIWYAIYFLAMSAARRRQSAPVAMLWSSLTGVPLLLLGAWLLGERIVPMEEEVL